MGTVKIKSHWSIEMKSRKTIKIIIAVLIVVLIGIVVILITRPKDTEETEKIQPNAQEEVVHESKNEDSETQQDESSDPASDQESEPTPTVIDSVEVVEEDEIAMEDGYEDVGM